MARLSDIPLVFKRVGPIRFALRLWQQVDEDNIFVWAAALAYSWLFAIFPFLIFLLTLLPYIPEDQKQQVLQSIDGFLKQLPRDTANILSGYIDATVTRVLRSTYSSLMSFGLLLAIWAASGGMAMTMSALDRCYDIDVNRPFYKHRPIAILLTLVTASLMLGVMIILPIGGIIMNWVWIQLKLPDGLYIAVTVLRWMLGVLLLMMALNVVYYFGTRVKQNYRFITPGAAFCVLTWIGMGLGFRFYVDHIAGRGYNLTYGTVGGVVILMFSFYLAAVFLLIGAEINSEIDYEVLGIKPGSLDFRKKDGPALADPNMPSP